MDKSSWGKFDKIKMKQKPKVYIATPCYDSMRVETCVSLIDTFSTLGRHGVECKFKSVKTSLVTHGRNLLTAGFLNSGFDYMLFVKYSFSNTVACLKDLSRR